MSTVAQLRLLYYKMVDASMNKDSHQRRVLLTIAPVKPLQEDNENDCMES